MIAVADDRQAAIADFKRIMKWIVGVAVLMVAGALTYLKFFSTLDTVTVIAVTFGVFFSVLLGCGLFAAAFFSEKSGLDQAVTDVTRSERAFARRTKTPSQRKEIFMTLHQPVTAERADAATHGRLFFLEINAGKIHSINPDGSDKRTIVTDARNPDGIAIDRDAGHIYWTNMGVPSLNDGSIERADLDGANRVTIVPPGGTHTPKQIIYDKPTGRLYWGDREGMRVMSCNLDGSDLQALVETGSGDEDRKDLTRWCVGVAIDHVWNEIYWTQKGPDDGNVGLLRRAPLALRAGETPSTRTDIETVYDRLPEPIDLEIADGWLYWTDRGDPPRGNTVNRIQLEVDEHDHGPLQIVVKHLMEGIGIATDAANDRMFVTDLSGTIHTARLDGSGRSGIAYAQGNLTGIAYLDGDSYRALTGAERNRINLADLEF